MTIEINETEWLDITMALRMKSIEYSQMEKQDYKEAAARLWKLADKITESATQ